MASPQDDTRFITWWRRVADDLGLEIAVPFDVVLKSDCRIRVPVLVRDFGGARGMLVVLDLSLIEDRTEELVKAGYGYSVLSEPGAFEEYNRDVFIEMLVDWGWWGPESERPKWIEHADPGAG